ncbi:TatD family hydrolase [Zhihengliuella salsuginis]|uniref:TatD family hydrolase n=1 Tax=Zhihengliuella salsuginis TaxID=578222 RepID=UPI0035715016
MTPGSTPPAFVSEEADDVVVPEGASPQEAERLAAQAARRRRRSEYPPAPEPLPVPVPDNHTHLEARAVRSAVSVADALDTANAVGVPGVVQVGCDVESSRFAVEAAAADPRVLAAVAIHPNDAAPLAEAGGLDAAIVEIDVLAGHERVRAVGETGLDYFRTGPEGHADQRASFEAHLDIAVRRGKALQIHDRDAHDDVVDVLRSAPRLPEHVVFHCFSGDAQLARICNDNGWYMSFAGTVTFKNSTGLHEALSLADPELVLVETDAPYLTPHPYRGRPNAAYMTPYTVRFMAGHTGRDLAGLCTQLAANTRRVYGEF